MPIAAGLVVLHRLAVAALTPRPGMSPGRAEGLGGVGTPWSCVVPPSCGGSGGARDSPAPSNRVLGRLVV